MHLVAAQVRQACTLLNWRSSALMRRARISYESARKARLDDGIAVIPSVDAWAIRTALERAGVRFAFDAEGQPNVVLLRAAPCPSPPL